MNKPGLPSHSNFIRQIIEGDLASGRFSAGGSEGKSGPGIRTRFPPEPNGYLHFGHAKAIWLNFSLAKEYGGRTHLRFDDTNPEKEEQQYVDAIKDVVRWFGYQWEHEGVSHEYYASDYFQKLYDFAEELVRRDHAYVDSQTPEQMREARGTLTEPGTNSPYRDRDASTNLLLLREMRDGKHMDGKHVLRAKIDMASPNINLRDPVMYRIRHVHHHRTGAKWKIYPTYDWAHGTSDAIERISHSLCTLEFEDHRPLYDWFNVRLADAGLLEKPLPQQIEFARLNLTYVVLSKRLLIQLVEEGHVDGWDDPRMPTLAGGRRRGYTAEGFRRFVERAGVSKAHQVIEFGILEEAMRGHLNEIAPRRMAVLDPIKLIIQNYPKGKEEIVELPNHPQQPAAGKREVPFSGELWIEREDYQENPEKGYFRLYPGNDVRLRFGYVIKTVGFDKETNTVHATYYEDSKSGTPGADKYKVKGNIHWVSAKTAHAAQVHLYDRLFHVAAPGTMRDFQLDLNPESKRTITAQLEPALRYSKVGESFQFERHGYFVKDPKDGGFNRTVTLRDSWSKTP